MWPFSSVTSLEDSGMLRGMTDWHSHLLPGVDDGFKHPDKSLEALARYEESGIRKVWLTPHIMEDYANETAELRDRFEKFREQYKGNIELRLAAENMLDTLFEERIGSKDVLPIGDAGEHLLVETSYLNPPYAMDDMLAKIAAAGLTPLLAHPERYKYMSEADYDRLKGMGIAFQMNYLSLVGGYGESARKKAEWLLKNDMIDVVGSDIHKLSFFENLIVKSPSKKQWLEKLIEIASNPRI